MARHSNRTPLFCLAALLVVAAAQASPLTPVIGSVLAPPQPVRGSDGRQHLIYELMLTNASGLPWKVAAVDVLADGTAEVVDRFAGEGVAARLQRLGDRSPVDGLEPGESAILFIHLDLPGDAVPPAGLRHRLELTMPGGIPPGLLHFAGLPADAGHLAATTAPTSVDATAPIVLGPPLAGEGWVAADGCCTAHRHVRAFLPLAGGLHIGQRFAIDWEKADGERRLFVGDPRDPKSYFAYGQEALAVADATVVSVLDGLPDQVPGELPPGLPLAEADGNHVVLDIGGGRYALYAHFVPGTLTVAVGDRVRRGQVLGRVGNSGNSSAPHLHFHVMDAPEPLAANGLPYVIDRFATTGRVASTAAFDRAEAEGTPLEMGAEHAPREHAGELPLDQSVVVFPSLAALSAPSAAASAAAPPEPLASPAAPLPDAVATTPVLPPEPPSPWRGGLGIGVLGRGGNTELSQISLNLELGWEQALWAWDLAGDVQFVDIRRDANTPRDVRVEEHEANFQLRREVSERIYGIGKVQWQRRPASGVDEELYVAGGVGYHLLRTEPHSFRAEVGLLRGRERRPALTIDYTAAFLDSTWRRTLPRGAELVWRSSLWQAVSGEADFYSDQEVAIESALTRRLAVALAGEWEYDTEPPPGFRESDYRLVGRLTFKPWPTAAAGEEN